MINYGETPRSAPPRRAVGLCPAPRARRGLGAGPGLTCAGLGGAGGGAGLAGRERAAPRVRRVREGGSAAGHRELRDTGSSAAPPPPPSPPPSGGAPAAPRRPPALRLPNPGAPEPSPVPSPPSSSSSSTPLGASSGSALPRPPFPSPRGWTPPAPPGGGDPLRPDPRDGGERRPPAAVHPEEQRGTCSSSPRGAEGTQVLAPAIASLAGMVATVGRDTAVSLQGCSSTGRADTAAPGQPDPAVPRS